jgi:hypothetical protein
LPAKEVIALLKSYITNERTQAQQESRSIIGETKKESVTKEMIELMG